MPRKHSKRRRSRSRERHHSKRHHGSSRRSRERRSREKRPSSSSSEKSRAEGRESLAKRETARIPAKFEPNIAAAKDVPSDSKGEDIKNEELKESKEVKSQEQTKVSNKIQSSREGMEEGEIAEEPEDAEEGLAKLFGMKDFSTTKEKSHRETAVEGVLKNFKMKRQFRQYMNRRKGLQKNLNNLV
eukprot:TRINITY_DN7442_c0_g1_i7.p3 TRINITY_DN7442_c0_g1~~TRINITY_DN7442_c0_g1_i7.p3  ORF type:complete len:186 (+),score=51.81 TRINITY_DN7442_c0_g1_i7:1062-1619(+)